MSDFILNAEVRETTGKAHARRMRRAGKIPGIIYGGDKQDLPISVEFYEVSKLLSDEAFYTSMLEVKVKGSRGKNTVLLKDTQWDPLKETITHLDFFRVSASDVVDVEVPVEAINDAKCPGVVAGGMIDVIRRHLAVQCRADSIPEHIEVDCSKLQIGDSIHIKDMVAPKGITFPDQHADAEADEEFVNYTVITCVPPTVEKAATETEADSE
ncbi:MAG: 50S ribosomal protein L25 [Zetaproteobacteria bacterium CG_4_9_14_3_um_filter_49_83]|nr:MAG: 50S ribosomal protein L25 [Zetaproteobacteria bacterium CG1_02_49_23]PIQ30205.1 MAG: 50S ribosomal protein L25 [Zetaproteobacteria bacterium CG17_big_fil_post_rev_8_21_14_2_50_50_13]PIV30988.1 MAG: 50S ribosomal protein L25 [Zetaproteobacteria bacterium CG02_land_8_20_14_3_00_50_9]PIY55148.1 MAG: 50S ribosomal protein L25 [Zetaproteobacteria bacterium CG_4_10_14_0_8_um_filter_49_80]PJA35098.1 MAG: 50S ribosomal protein L25 [Zetaproteobacteria bacterium CG_4_9_14_3_um_filter_49_83]